MAANLQSSAQRGGPSTRKTGKSTADLDPDLMLEILQDAINKCQTAGIQIQVGNLHDQGTTVLAIVLAGVVMRDDKRLELMR